MSDATDSALLARYLSGECSAGERQQVEAWILGEPGRRRMMERMAAVWDTQEESRPPSDAGALWAEMARRAGITSAPESPRRVDKGKLLFLRPPARRLLRYAAVLVAAIGLPYLASRSYQAQLGAPETPVLMTTVAETGQRAGVTLSDGTVVTLDAGSSLTYPERFPGGARQVTLNGEAYFEVAVDLQRPFIVSAHHARVEVLGTRFNVRAWERTGRVQVAVVEGKVSLRSREADVRESVVVVAGQASQVPAGGSPAESRPVAVDAYLDWMRDALAFEEAPLGEVMHRLERWYGVRFALEDSSVARERVTVHLERRSLEDALEVIAALTGQACEREGDVVRLESR